MHGARGGASVETDEREPSGVGHAQVAAELTRKHRKKKKKEKKLWGALGPPSAGPRLPPRMGGAIELEFCTRAAGAKPRASSGTCIEI